MNKLDKTNKFLAVFFILLSVIFITTFFLLPIRQKALAQYDPNCLVGCDLEGGGGGGGAWETLYYCTNPIQGGTKIKQQCNVNNFDSFPQPCYVGPGYSAPNCPLVNDPCTKFPNSSPGLCGGLHGVSTNQSCDPNNSNCNGGDWCAKSACDEGGCEWECFHNICGDQTGEQSCWGTASECYWYCPIFATPPPPSPIAKTCTVSLSSSSITYGQSVTVSFDGNNNNHWNSGVNSDTVKLWIERADGGTISSIGSCNVGCNNWSGIDACWYSCTPGVPTESRYYLQADGTSPGSTSYSGSKTISGLPVGNYVVHCDLQGNSNPCSGDPFCTYNGGNKNCGSNVSCSPTDHASLTVACVPGPCTLISGANSCGKTQTCTGSLSCDGSSCEGTCNPPANPAGYGDACTGATSDPNTCNDTNPGGPGIKDCDPNDVNNLICTGEKGTKPPERAGLGDICYSDPNGCNQKFSGNYICDSSTSGVKCSVPSTPVPPCNPLDCAGYKYGNYGDCSTVSSCGNGTKYRPKYYTCDSSYVGEDPADCCTNCAPAKPVLTIPTPGGTRFSNLPVDLYWSVPLSSWGFSCAGGTNTFTTYFDTSTDPSTAICSNLPSSSNTCKTGSLAQSTSYKWKVRANNGYLPTDSDIGYFTSCTESPPDKPILTTPGNGTITATVSPNLIWQALASWGKNCDGNQINTYTVYLDNNSNPITPICINVPAGTNNCQTTNLKDGAIYYWKVIASNSSPLTNTSTVFSFTTPYSIFGWNYKEANGKVIQSEESSVTEPLIPNYTVNLSGDKTGSTTTFPSPIPSISGNYIFRELQSGIYEVGLAATPTGYVLFEEPATTTTPAPRAYTNPQIALLSCNTIVNFPFVTMSPVPVPSLTPSVTPTSTPPAVAPTPTSVYAPTPTTIPGTPTPTPVTCPTPQLQSPPQQGGTYCTNQKPQFSANVSDPKNDNVWAHYYVTENSVEKFNRYGSTVYPGPGNSTWTPDASILNTTGDFWWTAYTESSSCSKSGDAPARRIQIDHIAPPKPGKPACSYVAQNLLTGKCTFSCSWPADLESAGASCSDTSSYQFSYRATPDESNLYGWSADRTKTFEIGDGHILWAKVKARDSANPGGGGNESEFSDEVGPYECKRINYSDILNCPFNISITPNPSLTPTNTPTPTPGAWIRAVGGDLYMNTISEPIGPGKYLLNYISTWDTNIYNNSIGVLWSGDGVFDAGQGFLSTRTNPNSPINYLDWKVAGSLSSAYNFTYFTEALKNKTKKDVSNPLIYPNQTVGKMSDLTATDVIYTYSGQGVYTLDGSFTGNRNPLQTDLTIFLISGSLDIQSDFTLNQADNDMVIFIVNGNINIGSNVRTIPGVYISSQTFSVASGSKQFTLNGMVYANSLSLKRSFYSLTDPAYEFKYQPQYIVAMFSYLGRSQINWLEVKP